jgi:hypothetical protein
LCGIVVTETSSQGRDLDFDVVLFNDNAWPDCSHKRVLRNQFTLRSGKDAQYVQSAAAKLDRLAIT